MSRPTTADQATVRKLNTSIVMECIRLQAPLSRAELAARTGLNRSTVSSIIDELIDRGFVHETTRQDPKIGRPGMLLQLNPEGGFAIGVEVGVDYISVILTNFVAEVLWRRRVNILPGEQQIAILEQAEEMISQAIAYGRQAGLRPLGIGVGMPGLVDAQQGKLVLAPNLKWVDMPVRLIWTRRFNLPVFVENEANCAALGELLYGVARDVQSFIYLSTGIGLGGGIIIDGRLFRGSSGYAGEVGHTTLYQGGEVCGCGRVGCWETYVSPAAMLRRTHQLLQSGMPSCLVELAGGDPQNITIETLVDAAHKNDPLALQIIHEVASHMAVGICNLINTFNPQLIVLGGYLRLTSEWLIPVIQESFQKNVLAPLRDSIQVQASAQEFDACTIGAIALVLDDIVREPLYSL
ncbi:MAG: ROK family transcriptional regulator [Chloroflexota bacterium]